MNRDANHEIDLATGGVLLVDKPRGMTSHDVVDRIRKVAGTRRVGHTGTLDPMAEGLLVVCIGPATRIVQFLVGLPKDYTGTIKLGAISSTYDAEGKITSQPQPIPSDPTEIAEAMQSQVGLRTQLAPPYSAVKVRGKKLYEYARQGEEVPSRPRSVHIHSFDLVDYCEPEIRFAARVGSGTYIRSMAHDLGLQLGCGAFLWSLRRESVGDFPIEGAVPLADLINRPELLGERLLGLKEALAHMTRITVAPEVERRVLHGRGFTTRDILACEELPRPAENSVVLNTEGKVLSVVQAEAAEAAEPPDSGDTEPVDESSREPAPEAERMLYFRPLRVLGVD